MKIRNGNIINNSVITDIIKYHSLEPEDITPLNDFTVEVSSAQFLQHPFISNVQTGLLFYVNKKDGRLYGCHVNYSNKNEPITYSHTVFDHTKLEKVVKLYRVAPDHVAVVVHDSTDSLYIYHIVVDYHAATLTMVSRPLLISRQWYRSTNIQFCSIDNFNFVMMYTDLDRPAKCTIVKIKSFTREEDGITERSCVEYRRSVGRSLQFRKTLDNRMIQFVCFTGLTSRSRDDLSTARDIRLDIHLDIATCTFKKIDNIATNVISSNLEYIDTQIGPMLLGEHIVVRFPYQRHNRRIGIHLSVINEVENNATFEPEDMVRLYDLPYKEVAEIDENVAQYPYGVSHLREIIKNEQYRIELFYRVNKTNTISIPIFISYKGGEISMSTYLDYKPKFITNRNLLSTVIKLPDDLLKSYNDRVSMWIQLYGNGGSIRMGSIPSTNV